MTCALYRHFDVSGDLLYVGISNRPDARFSQHKSKSCWADKVASTTVEWHKDRASALVAERKAIAAEAPAFNVQHHGKISGAAAFIEAVGQDSLSAALGVGLAAIRNAKWRDKLPASWASIVADICMDMGLNCPTSAFSWRCSAGSSECISVKFGLRAKFASAQHQALPAKKRRRVA